MMALNDTRLRSLKPKPGKTERLVADGNGLYVRLRGGEGGGISRTWQFRRREGGQLSIATLGSYPDLPILEARQQALELATKRTSYSPTVEVAAEQWLAERVEPTHRRAELMRGYVDRAIVPALGSRRVRDVEPSEIAAVVRDYRDRAGKTAKGREGGRAAGRALLGAFRGCSATRWRTAGSSYRLQRGRRPPWSGHRRQPARVLSDDEIRWS